MFRTGNSPIDRSEIQETEDSKWRPKSFIWSHPRFAQSRAVSFCLFADTSQLEILSQTLKQNLTNTRIDRESVEFVILIVAASETIVQFSNQFSEEIEKGDIQIFSISESIEDRIKNNLLFQLGKSKILSLLEFDEFVGPRASNYIFNTVGGSLQSQALWIKKKRRKSGRISLTKDLFYEIGGFDESISITKQVSNLVRRLRGYNVEVRTLRVEMFLNRIKKYSWDLSINNREINQMKNRMTPLEEIKINQVLG